MSEVARFVDHRRNDLRRAVSLAFAIVFSMACVLGITSVAHGVEGQSGPRTGSPCFPAATPPVVGSVDMPQLSRSLAYGRGSVTQRGPLHACALDPSVAIDSGGGLGAEAEGDASPEQDQPTDSLSAPPVDADADESPPLGTAAGDVVTLTDGIQPPAVNETGAPSDAPDQAAENLTVQSPDTDLQASVPAIVPAVTQPQGAGELMDADAPLPQQDQTAASDQLPPADGGAVDTAIGQPMYGIEPFEEAAAERDLLATIAPLHTVVIRDDGDFTRGPSAGKAADAVMTAPVVRGSPTPVIEAHPMAAARHARERTAKETSKTATDGLMLEDSGAIVAVLAAPRAVPTAVAVAIEFGRAGSGWAGSFVFNVWLRRQLRERRMTQRQLAAKSGVNHSTISRLLREERTPNLETATKLARAVKQVGADDDVVRYFDALSTATISPMQRVEAALRGDDELDDEDVHRLMDAYLDVRAKHRLKPAAASKGDIAYATSKRLG